MSSPAEYIATAKQIVKSVMESNTDKAGKIYYNHCRTVAEAFNDYRYICVGLLHDVLEDTPYTETDLRKHFPDEIVDAVVALTRKENEPYLDSYIPRVTENEIATKVKIADLLHNLDLTRLSHISMRDAVRNRRYLKALKILTLN